ncbi:hypothetical protein CROQUDRAFT_652659 [Cronartium quercuum f. sp. fusiforme G11]|uniref:P-loop containing nucleoside triphosphate hydrolase protein n=1 Tax=Cronartium quercuum f. sp. fusiforme G11 TaxID=708437 RepID=A0A9P6NQA8_9BASI|nr:hypothetical protein CROQUDRAFT_652659 [Cronartium quercuum f. sp. fusiforme G11]
MSKRSLSNTSFLNLTNHSPPSKAQITSSRSFSPSTTPLIKMTDQLNWRAGPSRGGRAPDSGSGPTTQTRTQTSNRTRGARGRPPRHQPPRPIKRPNLPTRDGPLCNSAYVYTLWSGSGQPRKPWIDNPKGVINNYIQAFTHGPPEYNSEQVNVDGHPHLGPLYRVTVVADAEANIIGVGDDTSKKEAEKLAALSACLQLGSQNLFDSQNLPTRLTSSDKRNGATNGKDLSAATHHLADGTPLTLDKARAYMDFYCRKFRFGKPDISFERSKGQRGRETWAATLFVGGRRIGMGHANAKKDASNEAYKDTVVYLAECDPELWCEFQTSGEALAASQGGSVPEVVFRLSNEMDDDLREIVQSSRQSELYRRAKLMMESARGSRMLIQQNPTTSNANRSTSHGCSGQGSDKSREQALKAKSEVLSDRLAQYQTDDRRHVATLREQRNALPVTAHASLVLSALATNPVTILMAATGSGKTTQVPQLILDAATMRGDGAKCNIICTQPRRIAAISVAQRVANERNEQLGDSIGYQVRFEAKPPTPDGSVLFCTTGVFLRRLQNDMESADGTFLDPITHVVVDEVHERDIDTDLLLFCLRKVLKDRKEKGKPEIKVLLMSATVDPTLFEKYFADPRTGKPAPVISVPGRSFPVEKHYLEELNGELRKLALPPSRGGWVWNDEKVGKYIHRELQDHLELDPITGKVQRDNDDLEMPYALIALVVAWVLSKSTDGHVLVFLPGWDEIKGVQAILLNNIQFPLLGLNFNDSSKFEVHVLHSSIPVVDQQKVFTPPSEGVRRVILSTNIAETSVTIPDVVFVVDTGKIKEKRFDPERHLSSLVTAWVGTSNLNQRAGRAGRHRAGHYYGLLSRRRYEALHIHSTVEMKRTDLSNLVMHVKALNFPNMEAEDVLDQTIEPPERERVSAAMSHLQTIGALDRHKDLTALGRVLLQLPVEAQIGKLLLLGSFFRCLEPALNLAAILTNRDPFLSPPAAKTEADRIKSSWAPFAFRSDPLACLAAFTAWSQFQDKREINRAYRFANDNFLSKPTLAQIAQVKTHLLSALRRAGVLAISGGNAHQSHHQTGIPPQLNKNSDSLPLLAALIAVAVAPNFAVRKSTKIVATEKDRVCFINLSSVNSYKKEAAVADDIPLQNERQLFAFGEKSLSLPRPGEKGRGQMSLRSTTRLDPLGYMLFGARRLQAYPRGLQCDGWLSITGDEGALDDVERLKEVLDASLLRVFDGLQAQIFRKHRPKIIHQTIAKVPTAAPAMDVDENSESDVDEDNEDKDEDKPEEVTVPEVLELKAEEIKDLERLTEGVVSLLNGYSEERLAADSSRAPSRPDSRATTSHNPYLMNYSGGADPRSGNNTRPNSRLTDRLGPSFHASGVPSALAPGGMMRAWGQQATSGSSHLSTPHNLSRTNSHAGSWR